MSEPEKPKGIGYPTQTGTFIPATFDDSPDGYEVVSQMIDLDLGVVETKHKNMSVSYRGATREEIAEAQARMESDR